MCKREREIDVKERSERARDNKRKRERFINLDQSGEKIEKPQRRSSLPYSSSLSFSLYLSFHPSLE